MLKDDVYYGTLRGAVTQRLEALGGEVEGATYGEVAKRLRCNQASITDMKKVLRSLARSTRRPKTVRVWRKRIGRTGRGAVVVTLR